MVECSINWLLTANAAEANSHDGNAALLSPLTWVARTYCRLKSAATCFSRVRGNIRFTREVVVDETTSSNVCSPRRTRGLAHYEETL